MHLFYFFRHAFGVTVFTVFWSRAPVENVWKKSHFTSSIVIRELLKKIPVGAVLGADPVG
jgi:hypothetical protein